MLKVGIDKIAMYSPNYYLDMTELAHARDVEPDKYLVGIGQEKMAITSIEQDIVSMGANAAYKILTEQDKEAIDQVIFATESGIDFSKAAATYIHELLGIQTNARSYEIKQACYSATASLQIACDYVRIRPDRKVLIIASDIARYGLRSSGEPTQGAGAIAMLISANPDVLAIDMESVSLTNNQFDFWRPNAFDVPIVESKYSTELYIEMFTETMEKIEEKYENILAGIEAIVFHLPFTKMGMKALKAYSEQPEKSTQVNLVNKWLGHYEDAIKLSRQIGNIYTGSLYLSLISLLIYSKDVSPGDRIALFSYGSGSVAELFTAEIQEKYLFNLKRDEIEAALNDRVELDMMTYEAMMEAKLPEEDSLVKISDGSLASPGFYLEAIDHYRRTYGFKEAK